MTPRSEPRACVLNVDDSDGALYVKTRLLTLAGFEVIEARSGGEALALARSRQPELVLLDVKLPDINGLEVCRRLKHDPQTRHILVLQTSASLVDSANRVKALDAGADSYLVEPIEPDELVANVNALLRLRRAEDAYRSAQDALGESEGRFRQLAETIDDVFWVLDTRAQPPRFIYVSPAYRRQWQCDGDLLLAQPQTWYRAVHPDDLVRMRALNEASAATGQAHEAEYRIVRADGEERWIAERAFPVLDAQGQAYRLAGVSQDITARKRAELLLVEADRHKNEFLAMLSHELRSPLAPIRNAVDVLELRADRNDPSLRAVQIIGRQVEHLARLVDDLLDVSRIGQGKISLDLALHRMDGVMGAAMETARPAIEAQGHTVRVTLPQPAPVVRGDGVRLAQVFSNLLNNAAKFTPAQGTIEVEAVVVDAAGPAPGPVVEVTVRDNGMGISADVLPRVFDLFAQADQTLDRSQGGLGIGLSLVRSIVGMHGGSVRAESGGVGAGSRFVVTLPVVESAQPPADAPPASGHTRVLRVLVVDDNEDAVETMALLLESQGHSVVTATTGPLALARAAEMQPDVVLLDIGLPGMSGYEVARALRAAAAQPTPVLVAISGYGREADREQARQAGFNHHLVKPADPDKIFSIIAGV